MDKHFQACAVCTSTCFKEHGSEQPRTYSRPPCFLLPSSEVSTNWTPIPKEFVDVHGDALRGTARILDANGKEWTVEIGGPGKFLGFKGGWKSFVANMSVKRGEQMLFALVSKSCFLVQVFNKLGVEVVPAAPVVAAAAPATGKRKRPEVKAELLSDDESDDDDDDGSSDSDMSEYEASKSDAEDVSESDADASPKVVDEELEVSKPRKRVKRKFTGSKAVTTTKPASHKKKVEGMYIEPGSCTTTYESRRREVTKAELDRTMERAKAFKTKFPSIPVHMMPSHVYRGFWLTIPGRFSKEFMPQGRLEVKLEDEHGFEWPATWIRSEKHTGLSGGWAAFSKDHCLEEGDVCVFEVVNSTDWTIVVHIFRVVEVDLKPGARGGWEKTYNIVHGSLMHQPGVAKKFKSRTSTGVKKRTSTTGKKSSTVKRSRRKASSESGSDGSDGDDDDVPLTKLYGPSSDVTSEEVDVKPKIISMGPIPKIAKVKREPDVPAAVVKVKQEPGVAPVKLEPGVAPVKREDCVDVKPTLQELKASLCQASSGITTASISVKPEPMDTSEPVGRTWHPVVRMLKKRQSPISPTLHEILVNLGPRVICSSASSSATEDGNGNWWVPRSQFSPDLATCYID